MSDNKPNGKDKTERKFITIEEYAASYVPASGWILVEKHTLPDKYGGLYTAQSTKDLYTKQSTTGVVLAKSPADVFDSEYIAYQSSLIDVGDWVCFSSMTPIFSPSPPHYEFEGRDKKAERLVTLHVSDVIAHYCPTPEIKADLIETYVIPDEKELQ